MEKIILFFVLSIFSFNCFAFTQAEVLRSAFNSDKFVKMIGEELIKQYMK